MIYLASFCVGLFLSIVFVIMSSPSSDENSVTKEPDYTDRRIYDFQKSCWGHSISSWRPDDEGESVRVLGHGSSSPPFEGDDPFAEIKKAGRELTRAGGSFSINTHYPMEEGDIMRVEMKSGFIYDMEIVSIEYFRDPRDMFKATLEIFQVLQYPEQR